MKFIRYYISILSLVLPVGLVSQVIPLGSSLDSLTIITPPNTYIQEGKYGIHYYKPVGYNSLNSPVLFYIHGTGGNGGASADLQTIADRQNALIVAPTMHNGTLGHAYVTEALYNTVTGCSELFWYTNVMKDIYRHVLARESRASIDAYLTGFSSGGQFVSRYMFIRQFSSDSIPVKMAVSVNASNYTLMTDTFNNIQMAWYPYRCGLDGIQWFKWGCSTTVTVAVNNFVCTEHIKQYYNENYGALCGEADTTNFTGFCPSAQGADRFDRMKKFYAFSQSNAITRGTNLKWICDSVIGVSHDQPNMYNTKRNVTDTFTIAERMIFKTPFHTVQQFSPSCLGGVGINDLTVKNISFSIFPNPSNSECLIQLNGISNIKEIVRVEVSNSLGQFVSELYNSSTENQELKILFDTKNLCSGLYLIKTMYGGQVAFKKLLIEH